MSKLVILTPTYNRAYRLRRAYDSLVSQECKDFLWLVIDDGSSDDTEKLIKGFIKDDLIKIKYYKKDNGGKHTAINYGMSKIDNNSYVLILDSDDFLTYDAVSIVYKYISKYDSKKNIASISFLRGNYDGKPLTKLDINSDVISNNIDFRYNEKRLADMCEVYRASILKKYPFPVFKGEKFLSEAIVWNDIALSYDTVYTNKVIYLCEYLEDGLSKNWFKSVVNCPKGARTNSLMFMNKKFNFSVRLKNCCEFGVFSFLANEKIIKDSPMKILSIILYIPSFVISLYFKYKQ